MNQLTFIVQSSGYYPPKIVKYPQLKQHEFDGTEYFVYELFIAENAPLHGCFMIPLPNLRSPLKIFVGNNNVGQEAGFISLSVAYEGSGQNWYPSKIEDQYIPESGWFIVKLISRVYQ